MSAGRAGLLTPGEVAALFGVDPKTVTRWARNGKLPAPVRTLGGHRRYRRTDIEALLTPEGEPWRSVTRSPDTS